MAHKKVYPQSVSGTFRRIKWGLMAFCLGVYYLLPFVRWNRGLGAPDQAVLVDLPNSRFYFFFIELWPQEVYYFTGLLILAAITLFLMNSVGGRHLVRLSLPADGLDRSVLCRRAPDRGRPPRAHAKGCRQGTMKLERIAEIVLKHSIWLMIAWWTGGAWVLYFNDAPTLVKQLVTFQAPMIAYIWIAILTATTYVLRRLHARAGLRLHVPVAAHPGGADRRMGAQRHLQIRSRREAHLAEEGERIARARPSTVGDCIDCYQCVAVCPTGIDIRDGAAARLHPVRPVHRRLRYRDDQDRPANPA